ncbi:MAG: Dam family site-specific DNA-(adenine-N6)-methyltransferase [Clostridia bacterium]|nr:Dam family site-specific DNA-(adenine-N6)-methyltransferase [Clostridia bacterium]
MEKLDINNRRYLGSKNKLLGFIEKIIEENCSEYNSFLDIFGGTGVVANAFNKENKKIYINDILKSNYCSYKAWFSNEEFDSKKIENIIYKYNAIDDVKDNYFSENFGNKYFSMEDSKKIGMIREDIETKFKNKEINSREKSILITSLLYSVDRIANTVGHYDAYIKKDKINNCFKMIPLDIKEDNRNIGNEIYNMDCNELAKKIKSDIVYIDPPYNSRQYSDAYHLLENLAEWKKPEVFGVARKMDRTGLKSEYCTIKATKVFKDLVDNLEAKYILVSYNNMGEKGVGRSQAKISDKEIIEILESKGNVKVFETNYNTFTTGKTKIENHKERIFFCEVKNKNIKKFFIDTDSSNSLNNVKSPINYTGGKYKLLNQIEPFFPEDIDTFVDIFCGGFNVGANIKAKKIIANDNQENLVRILELMKNNSYINIIDNIENIIEKYGLSNTYRNGYKYYNANSGSGLGKYNKTQFGQLRKDYNCIKEDSKIKDYMFLTLLIYSFNNQIRFNKKGEFNSPVGKRDFNNAVRKNLLHFNERLANINVDFINKDYKDVVKDINNKMFFYFDPPYYLGEATYNENSGWNGEKEIELLDFIKEIDSKGNKFALSNVLEHRGMKNDILIDWCEKNNFIIHNLDYNYNNSNYHKLNKNDSTKEVLITNYRR